MKINLEPFSSQSFSRFISWVTDEKMLMQFAGPIFSYPVTEQQLNEYMLDDKRKVYTVVDETSKAIGHAEIYFPETTTALLCRLLIADPSSRAKGCGSELVNRLLHIAFIQHRVEKVELNVFDFNIAAIKCYERAGFTITEGIRKRREVGGETWIALNMQLMKSDWKNSRGSHAA